MATFNLQHIILISSHFDRKWNIDFSAKKENPIINIDVNHSVNQSQLSVTVNLNFQVGADQEFDVKAQITMVGAFNIENPDETVEQFANVNAPAIIFPFIREHLATVSLKAGINSILLSPINFVEHSKNKKAQKLPE